MEQMIALKDLDFYTKTLLIKGLKPFKQEKFPFLRDELPRYFHKGEVNKRDDFYHLVKSDFGHNQKMT
jgi:hypothetical protein